MQPVGGRMERASDGAPGTVSRPPAAGNPDKQQPAPPCALWALPARFHLALVVSASRHVAGLQDPVERLALSADRRRLASVAHDSTLRLWDLGALHDEDPDAAESADEAPAAADGADVGARGLSGKRPAAAAADAQVQGGCVLLTGCLRRGRLSQARSYVSRSRLCIQDWARNMGLTHATATWTLQFVVLICVALIPHSQHANFWGCCGAGSRWGRWLREARPDQARTRTRTSPRRGGRTARKAERSQSGTAAARRRSSRTCCEPIRHNQFISD